MDCRYVLFGSKTH
uniref:Uncharacterized protein n=1 Tax=Arundo donax TaxID=35708 RepID=A0A0A9BHV4_ARUDO